MKHHWLRFCGLLAVVLMLSMPAYAQDPPPITPSLKKLTSALPIPGIEKDLQAMMGALKKTPCGTAFTGCYMTQTGNLQLYFFTSGQAQQTLLLVVDESLVMPNILGKDVQKVMGQTSLRSPIFSISTTDYELDYNNMPAPLQKVVQDKYFGINTLEFSSGVQVASRANLGGVIKLSMEAMGVNVSQLMIRAGVVMPIPTDLAGGAGAGIAVADAAAHGATMEKAAADALKPEAFMEFQFAPKTSMALIAPQMTLTDATFFINNELVFGYKGNASFRGAEKKNILTKFKTPLSPEGGMDLLDFEFYMATPANFTMEDAANVMVAMQTPDPRLLKYGGGYISNISQFSDALKIMNKPLSVFQLKNPVPVPEYRFGDRSKPWPDDPKYFNIVLLGPLADNGPYMKLAGEVHVLGQKMGWLDASAGTAGLHGDMGESLSLKMGPLGDIKLKMQALIDISKGHQDVSLKGNFAGQKVEVSLSGSTMAVYVNASCVNPFEIKTQVTIQASTNIAEVFKGQGGVNVDPSKIGGCIGKELEAAYNKIAKEFSHLGGYTASAANVELNKIARAAEVEYNRVKQEARKAAETSINAASSGFSSASNAVVNTVGSTGKAQKVDYRFHPTVFDWDYYYDKYPDLVKNKVNLVDHWRDTGFEAGLQGSLEFNRAFYSNRYPTQVNYKGLTAAESAAFEWIFYGPREGRQGSNEFDVQAYLGRHSDLQNAFGATNYQGAMEHWFSSGKAEGRDGRSYLTSHQSAGGNGGAVWNDYDVCQGQQVIGFRIRAGSRVDGLQFQYPGGWGAVRGKLGNAPYTYEITLPAGQYFNTVHYRSGGMIDAFGLISNTGTGYGMFGGKGGNFTVYSVTGNHKLGCMAGRSGSSIDALTFSSTELL